MTLADALLVFISIGVTAVGGILTWLVLNIVPKIDTLWQSYFGVDSAGEPGFRERVDEETDDLRNVVEDHREETHEEHMEVRRAFRSIEGHLEDLNDALSEEDIDAPEPDLEDRFFRGGDD